jgi:2-succinyl-5-enolpyruvyl-6-hydroxy-3-cyclohexene-1-carboxylate synthase
MTVQAAFAATLVDEWIRSGITDAVVAPGSRSTPLALALAARSELRLHVVLDERDAGFYALGLGLASGRPAVVLTTSGTAAVELHPAVVEASQARVPLLACTADRPVELHAVHAPQTVPQSRLFGDAPRWFVEPGVAAGLPPSSWRSLASRMIVEATAHPLGPGPVHANLAFADPLVGIASVADVPPGRPDNQPWHRADPPQSLAFSGLAPLPAGQSAESGDRGGGVLVIAGAGAPMVDVGDWPVLADPRSGYRGHANAVCAFDGILRSERFVTACRPDVVVRLGAPPASKVLSQWLASLDAQQYIVDPFGGWPDPERRATARLPVLGAISATFGGNRAQKTWQLAEAAAQAAIDRTIDPHSEPGVIRSLTRDVPEDTVLFVSSSMPIRDIEWFGHPASRHRVLSNRGANGIDGIVATALGVASAQPTRPVVAMVGDLAFLYNASALLWATARDVDLTFVVLDNDGGGIFSFLPQRDALDAAQFETLFGTPHGIDIAAVAAAYGVPTVARVGDGNGVRVVRVRTDRARNVEAHRRLNDAIVAAVDAVAQEPA